MTRPTLQEIAAMPYPASEQAMRKHYDPDWHRFSGDGELRTYKASVSYSYTVSKRWFCEVEASSKEEAESLVEDRFDDECDDAKEDRCEIDGIKINEVAK
jgi:hypothetical protein